MRFMMLMIPGGYATAAPDVMPSANAVEEMMKYNEALKRAEEKMHELEESLPAPLPPA